MFGRLPVCGRFPVFGRRLRFRHHGPVGLRPPLLRHHAVTAGPAVALSGLIRFPRRTLLVPVAAWLVPVAAWLVPVAAWLVPVAAWLGPVAAWPVGGATAFVSLMIRSGPVSTGLAPGRSAGRQAPRWQAARRQGT